LPREAFEFWEYRTGRRLGQLPDTARGCTVLGTGKVLAIHGAEGAQMWDVATARPQGPRFRPGEGVQLAFESHDGKTIFTVGRAAAEASPYKVRRWRASTGNEVGKPITIPGNAPAADVSPDGRWLLAFGVNFEAMGNVFQAQLFDLATGRPIGPPFEDEAGPMGVVTGWFTANSGLILTQARRQLLWGVPPPLPGGASCLRAWAQALAKKKLDPEGALQGLTEGELEDRQRRLQGAGCRPPSVAEPIEQAVLASGHPDDDPAAVAQPLQLLEHLEFLERKLAKASDPAEAEALQLQARQVKAQLKGGPLLPLPPRR
jgi:hypothetical protein